MILVDYRADKYICFFFIIEELNETPKIVSVINYYADRIIVQHAGLDDPIVELYRYYGN